MHDQRQNLSREREDLVRLGSLHVTVEFPRVIVDICNKEDDVESLLKRLLVVLSIGRQTLNLEFNLFVLLLSSILTDYEFEILELFGILF
jgi:hypothetical protein